MTILVLDIIFLLAIYGYAFSVANAPIDTPNNPLTVHHLFSAYAMDQATANQQYSGKVAYVIATNSAFGVGKDSSSGQYYSTPECDCARLYWQNLSQAVQLARGETFLAKCTIEGFQQPAGFGMVVYLRGCTSVPPSQF